MRVLSQWFGVINDMGFLHYGLRRLVKVGKSAIEITARLDLKDLSWLIASSSSASVRWTVSYQVYELQFY